MAKKTWEDWYAEVCCAINSGVKITTTTVDYNGNHLGAWVSRQRNLYNSGKLPLDKVNKLVTVGLLNRHTPSPSWDEMYNLASNMVNSGKMLTHNTISNGVHVGDWVACQRVKYKNNKLTPEQVTKLKAIGLL